MEHQQLAEVGSQCHLRGAEPVVEVDQENSSRLSDRARRSEAREGIEDEDEDGVGSGAKSASKDRRAADSVVRTGVSMV